MSPQLPAREKHALRPSGCPAPAPGKPPWWLWGSSGLLVLLALGFVLLRGQGNWPGHSGGALPRFGTVPAFSLLERSGQTVGSTELRGRVWVANFIYTRCVTECGLLTNMMAQLQGLVTNEPDVRLVSITVDPEYDTPEVLAHYAESFAADPQRWWFLTGEKAVIYRLAVEGFYLGVSEPQVGRKASTMSVLQHLAGSLGVWLGPAVALAHHPAPPTPSQGPTVLHSARFVLVDRQGDIRQYYNGMEPESVRRIYTDMRHLLQER
ncbi:MAG: SCO family protein [Candidatus Tectimicrobiota bacterium]